MTGHAAAASSSAAQKRGLGSRRSNKIPYYILLAALFALFIFLCKNQAKAGHKATVQNDVQLQTGSVMSVDYYHCPASKSSSNNRKDLVLLHGAAFDKEKWKETGILEEFCATVEQNLAVTALDFSVRSSKNDLQNLLQAMKNEQLIQQLPVTALVTPSASGSAVSQWVRSDYEEDQAKVIGKSLASFVRTWIPVASGSVMKLSDEAVKVLQKETTLDILSIHGDRDEMGKKTSAKLQNLAGANVQELKGPHPVYLESPTEFVQTVLKQLAKY